MKKFAVVLLLLSACSAYAGEKISAGEFVRLCMYGTGQQVEEAIKLQGADVNAEGTFEAQMGNVHITNTHKPLGAALNNRRYGVEVAQALINAGADVNRKDSTGRTFFHIAVSWSDDAEMIKAFMSAPGVDVNAKDNNGVTPLMAAKNARIAGMLIRAGADVNAKDNNGLTPLLHAVDNNSPTTVSMLIKSGADIDVKAERYGSMTTPLLTAAEKNSNTMKASRIIRILLEAGANVEEANSRGETALMLASEYAARKEDEEDDRVKELLIGGASVYAVDSHGQTAIVFAVKGANVRALKALIAAGAPVNVRDMWGDTLLEVVQKDEYWIRDHADKQEEIIRLLKSAAR